MILLFSNRYFSMEALEKKGDGERGGGGGDGEEKGIKRKGKGGVIVGGRKSQEEGYVLELAHVHV